MSVLNPIWLWGLGALVIPIGIHLLSRKEGKTIRLGSIRFLTETSTSKFSSIRLNEVVLLAVRCLLVMLIVLFLAGLLMKITSSGTLRKWALVEKGLENESHIKILTDSLQKNGFEVRKLADGFPVLDSDTAQRTTDYYMLAEALSKENDLQAVVFATNSISGFKGKRDPLPENITWLTYPLSATRNSPSVDLLQKSDTLHITLAYDNNFQDDKKIILAALHALQDAAPRQVAITETDTRNFQSSDNSDWLIWLSSENPIRTGKLLYFKESRLDELISPETTDAWILTQHLTVANAVEQHLPVQLMAVLFQKEMRSELFRHDTRTVSNELAWSHSAAIQPTSTAAADQPLDKILFASISLLFIAERILAFYRKQ